MRSPHSMRLVLDLDPDSEPISGSVVAPGAGHTARSFSGWVELASLIERSRAAANNAAGARDFAAGVDPANPEPRPQPAA